MPLHVNSSKILEPLTDVYVIKDSRFEMLPGTREYTEEIPGRHGEYDFGEDFRPRSIELRCVVEVSYAGQLAKMREIAEQVNPLNGVQELTFADDPGKVYKVKYAGSMAVGNLNRHATYMEFMLPFKMTDPFIYSDTENSLVGSGVITNGGSVETPLIIEIQGDVTDPSIDVGGDVLSYTGTVTASDMLIIDTGLMTVTFNGANALANYSGGFPKLSPGDTSVTAASTGTTTFKWTDRWL